MTERPTVTMDRGAIYSTVHGERGPDDPDAGVAFMQLGLPFNGQGHLMWEHHSFEPARGDDASPKAQKLRKQAEAMAARQAKMRAGKRVNATRPPVDPEDLDPADEIDTQAGGDVDDDDDEDFDPNKPMDVDMSMFLRGEQEVPWHVLTQEIAGRYKRRVANMHDAIQFLVVDSTGPMVMPAQAIARRYQKHLD